MRKLTRRFIINSLDNINLNKNLKNIDIKKYKSKKVFDK